MARAGHAYNSQSNKMKIPEVKIEWIDRKEIKPYEANAKKHPKKQVQQIADSITNFGFLVPIVIDKNMELVAGHGRMLASELLELEKVPVIRAEHLSEEAVKAYRLADNKLNESDWDMKLVIAELKGLSLPMLDLTGFSRDLIIENDDKDDVVPGLPTKPKSKIGDVYELGDHRLVVGDSCDPETYRKLMAGTKADMVFTDPPYNVAYKGRGENTSRGIENDDMSDVAFDQFLEKFFKSAVEVTKGGAGWYVFHASSSQEAFKLNMKNAGLEVKATLIWNKPTASMGWGDYRWKHEPFYYGGKAGSKITFYGDRTNKTVIDFHGSEEKLIAWAKQQKRMEISGLTTIWTMKRDSVQEYAHPTQKPVELITYAIVNSSKEGDVVLDPFGGSGSTIIACQKTHRRGFSIELDPGFADVIVQRFVDFTEQPDIIKNGKPEKWQLSTFIASKEGADAEKKSEGTPE